MLARRGLKHSQQIAGCLEFIKATIVPITTQQQGLATNVSFTVPAERDLTTERQEDYQWTDKSAWEESPDHTKAEPDGTVRLPDQYGRPSVMQYNARITQLGAERRAWLVRDVYEEMLLDGVAPDWTTYEEAMWANMRSRRVADTVYFFNQMARRGLEPTSFHYNMKLAAFGRGGLLKPMEAVVKEMEAAQVPWTRQTFNGIMNAYAEVGDTQRCRELCQRMAQQGISPDEVTYSTVLRSYAHRRLPADPAWVAEILSTLETGREAMGHGLTAGAIPAHELVIINSTLWALANCGFHTECVDLFQSLHEGFFSHSTSHIYNAIITSYLKDAVGKFRQPREAALAAQVRSLLEERGVASETASRDGKLYSDMEARDRTGVSAEQAHAAADYQLDKRIAEQDGAELTEDEEDQADEQKPQDQHSMHPASTDPNPNLNSKRIQDRHAKNERRAEEAREEWRLRNPGKVIRTAVIQARTDVFNLNMNLDSLDTALQLFREARDNNIVLSPDLCGEFVIVRPLSQKLLYVELMQSAIRCKVGGHRTALEICHEIIDFMQQSGLFINTGMGSAFLGTASRRSVNDLQFAHRIWELLARSRRVPDKTAIYAYMMAVIRREPENQTRIRELRRILDEFRY